MLLAAFLAAGTPIPASAPSQQTPPPKSQAIRAEERHNKPEQPENSTKPSPLVVEAHVSGKLETTSEQSGQNTQTEENRWTDPISIFTLGLVLIGAIQCWLIFKTLKATETAANAAKQAAEAIPLMERPYIFIWGVSLISRGGSPPDIRYNVTNSGKLAAIIETVSVRFGPRHEDQFPPLVVMGDHSLLQTPVFSADEETEITYNVDKDQTEYGIPVRLKNEHEYIFQIVIVYRGPFTSGHVTGQCWRYSKDPRGFVEIQDSRYTFTR